jgi:serine/threonine-protein kinase
MSHDNECLTLESGTRLQLQGFIARSSFGEVWRARWLENGLPVAVKRVRSDKLLDAGPAERTRWVAALENEAAFLGSLRSPHVVRAFEHGRLDGQPILVLEALQCSLHQWVAPAGKPAAPLPTAQALGLLGQIARGLHHIHRRGVRHLDIKPQNILLTADLGLGPRAKIADFGTCLAHADAEHPFCGTLGWQAPEQVIPLREDLPPAHARYRSGVAADYYALGLVLFFMLTGRQPRHCSHFAAHLRHTRQAGAWGQHARLQQSWALSQSDRAAVLYALGEGDPPGDDPADITWHARTPSTSVVHTGSPAVTTAMHLLDGLLAPAPAERLSSFTVAVTL